ncbi:MAG: hypothetical protein WCW14_04745 [Candidatus Paceibacterota bacterium]|jgi:disulfide bond formation protein DsbB
MKNSRTLLILSIAGLLFSGYLSGIKLFTSTCAFNEPCPYFLGYPACWYGFAMYLIMFIASVILLRNKMNSKGVLKIITVVSVLGIIFAGYFTIPEVTLLINGAKSNYGLGLPTCAYGLIFFIAIFIVSIFGYKKDSTQTI